MSADRIDPLSERSVIARHLDDLARNIGLGLTQVQITGHRYTPDTDIYRALDIGPTESQLSFDGAGARRRLEQLPWVKSATIQRVFPDGISVSIIERAAFAVWRRPVRDLLVDETGLELGAVSPGTDLGLPAIAGDGAGHRAAEIVNLTAEYPTIAQRVALARRIADRRWRLELVGRSRIELPAEGAAAALARFVARTPTAALAALLDGSGVSIDLRSTEHMIVRRSIRASSASLDERRETGNHATSMSPRRSASVVAPAAAMRPE